MSNRLSKTTATEHLKHDIKHGFIEVLPGDRSQPSMVSRHRQSSFHPNDIIKVIAKENPKQPNTRAHRAFSLYRDGMTVAEFERAYGEKEFIAAFDEQPIEWEDGPRTLLPGLPGHNYWAERVRQILSAHVADLGGIDSISEAERSVLRRASTITIECERLERKLAAFPASHIAYRELDLYSRLSNSLRRLLDMTGLEKRGPKTLIPSIEAYVASRTNSDTIIDVPMQEAAE